MLCVAVRALVEGLGFQGSGFWDLEFTWRFMGSYKWGYN